MFGGGGVAPLLRMSPFGMVGANDQRLEWLGHQRRRRQRRPQLGLRLDPA